MSEKRFVLHEKRRGYQSDDSEYECLKCHRRFRVQYDCAPKRQCGTATLMRNHAWSNFKKHMKACWGKKEITT